MNNKTAVQREQSNNDIGAESQRLADGILKDIRCLILAVGIFAAALTAAYFYFMPINPSAALQSQNCLVDSVQAEQPFKK
jgi:hypothetical protein